MTQDETRDRIVAASARLLAEEGAAAVTTRRVAGEAGVQAPTIYRLFGDKEGLVAAVAEHVMSTYVSAKAAAPLADDPVDDLRRGWHAHVDFALANADLYVLMGSGTATAAGVELLRSKIRRLAAAGLLRVDEQRAYALVRAAGTGTVHALLELPAEQRDLSVADTMYDAVAAAVLVDGAHEAGTQPEDEGLVTAVVTLSAALADLPVLSDAERSLMGEWLARCLAALPPARARTGGH